jgi:L-fuconolactonase
MWGSDWPMTLLTAGYTGTWEVLSGLLGELTDDEQGKILDGTVHRVYRLSTEEE